MTDFEGNAKLHVRYTAHGHIRHQSPTADPRLTRYRFTEYEHEPITELADAGARFYDPQLAIFLTHNPAREFASPYTYDERRLHFPIGVRDARCPGSPPES